VVGNHFDEFGSSATTSSTVVVVRTVSLHTEGAALDPIGLLDTPPGEGGHRAGTCVLVRLLQPPIIAILSAPPCFQQVFYLHVLFTYRVTLLGQHCALLGC
jgi:hypothetical protein